MRSVARFVVSIVVLVLAACEAIVEPRQSPDGSGANALTALAGQAGGTAFFVPLTADSYIELGKGSTGPTAPDLRIGESPRNRSLVRVDVGRFTGVTIRSATLRLMIT